jgi:putative membrane protein
VNFIIKILVNAAALWVAARFVPGIDLTADIWQILLIALVFGIINTFLKPILKILSLPVIILTLGLFAIIVNVILLAITAGLMDGLTIDGFLPALLGSIVISIVSAILSAIIPDSN